MLYRRVSHSGTGSSHPERLCVSIPLPQAGLPPVKRTTCVPHGAGSAVAPEGVHGTLSISPHAVGARTARGTVRHPGLTHEQL
jgi:hypothetical protein